MLNVELVKSYKINEEQLRANNTLTFANTEQAKTIARQSATIQTVNKQFNELFDKATKPKPFFEKPLVLFGGGFVIGTGLTVLIVNAARK